MKIFHKGHLTEAEITQWLRDLRRHAYAPESGFLVACVFRLSACGQEDYYCAGVNVENREHRMTTHAEEGAIAVMAVIFGTGARIAEGWMMGDFKDAASSSQSLVTCCGKCRQQISAFAGPEVKIHSVAPGGKVSCTTVGAFLPDVFSLPAFKNDQQDAPAPSFEEGMRRLLRTGPLPEKDIFIWLRQLQSISPVTHKGQSVVLKMGNGAYVAGVKVEDAAFLAMNPLQAALAIGVAATGFAEVSEVWICGEGDSLTLAQSADFILHNVKTSDLDIIVNIL